MSTATVWVYKHDGTIQCESKPEISLEEMRKSLATIIGDANILNMEKRNILMIRLCGAPTGNVNAYEITLQGAFLLFNGYLGSSGFQLFSDLSKRSSEADIHELFRGYLLRTYKFGDSITKDYRVDRINIVTNEDNRILDIYIG